MERLKTACEFVGNCAFIALVAFLVWAFCEVTPEQLSGEADRQCQECENDAGVEHSPAFGREVR